MSIAEIRAELQNLARGNDEYAEFNRKIVNTQQSLIGARIPALRKMAKSLTREMTFAEILNLLNSIDKNSYEEILLIGLMIGYAKLPDTEKIELFREYLKLVDNWAQIDTAVTRKMNSGEWWNFALENLKSSEEFVVRFGVIILLSNFLKAEFLDQVFAALKSVQHDGYYVKMGIAWLFATAATVDYEKTLREVEKLESWTRRKALTKMLESYQFTDIQKQQVRSLRDKHKEDKAK